MKLKSTLAIVNIVSHEHLEKLVREVYGVDENYYIFGLDNEICSDGISNFQATKGALDECDMEELERWKKGEFSSSGNFITQTLILDLCDKGIIDTGDYYIH